MIDSCFFKPTPATKGVLEPKTWTKHQVQLSLIWNCLLLPTMQRDKTDSSHSTTNQAYFEWILQTSVQFCSQSDRLSVNHEATRQRKWVGNGSCTTGQAALARVYNRTLRTNKRSRTIALLDAWCFVPFRPNRLQYSALLANFVMPTDTPLFPHHSCHDFSVSYFFSF